jgi:uncharacterized protein
MITATAVRAIADDRVNVPCGSCRLCCIRQNVILLDEDNPAEYQCHPRDLGDGLTVNELDHKPNGDCVYLDRETGCTIHERAPVMCRQFDCRQAYRMHGRAERRRRIATGLASAAVYEAGRARLKAAPDIA